LVSYPRSGNTWLRLALEALIEGASPRINRQRLSTPVTNRGEFDELLCVESSELTDAEIEEARPELYRALANNRSGCLILRKVHDRYWRTSGGQAVFPCDISRGAVYLVRDPRDIAISLADFWGKSIDWTIDFMADPNTAIGRPGGGMIDQLKQPLGAWSDHVTSWIDNAPLPIHLLRYEDMLAEPSRRIAEAARFAGLNDGGSEFAAMATNFGALRRQEDAEGFVERPSTAQRFFRQGKSGAWRQLLTSTQSRRIERDHGAMMRRLGYA
jgi:hypothetical protein